MSNRLRAVVVGAGWAGEGHTKALQWCGVEVVAICGRQQAVVQEVANRLGVAGRRPLLLHRLAPPTRRLARGTVAHAGAPPGRPAPVGDDEQQKWCALAQDFIADIRGEPHHPYLTFRDGWRALVAIGAIRAGRGPTSLPTWRLERHRQVLHAVDDGAGHRLQRTVVGAA
jgi:predicted dehydrogenase